MIRTVLVASIAALLAASVATADTPSKLIADARDAVSADVTVAESAIARLRAAGPQGLLTLTEVHADALNAHRNRVVFPLATTDEWKSLSHALNEVGGQYDCHASRLYWHTDLDEAKRAAQASGKPILSLRMLGKLTEECSCANSRFFRTALYANQDVSVYLREHFVLHWKSVRPVPKVTIDFGDGRKLERTLTGNSIHYVLDAEGHPIDALPGLYGPKAFLRHLKAAELVALRHVALTENERATLVREYHQNGLTKMQQSWTSDLIQAGLSPEPSANTTPVKPTNTTTTPTPTAAEAAPLAIGKSVVEIPLLVALSGKSITPGTKADGDHLTDEEWAKIATLHTEDATLDEGSITLMREHHPSATKAALTTMTKRLVEDPIIQIVAGFQRSVAEDTVRNEYIFRQQIRLWFLDGQAVTREVETLNQRVYAELFLTPDSDPWLGLHTPDAYTGIRDNGVKTP